MIYFKNTLKKKKKEGKEGRKEKVVLPKVVESIDTADCTPLPKEFKYMGIIAPIDKTKRAKVKALIKKKTKKTCDYLNDEANFAKKMHAQPL